MRVLVFTLTILALAATDAAAADLINGRHQSRAFWLYDQGWPNPQDRPATTNNSEFPMTYTDGVARRLGVTAGHLDIFERKLGTEAPSFVATVDGGAPKVLLRWHIGD